MDAPAATETPSAPSVNLPAVVPHMATSYEFSKRLLVLSQPHSVQTEAIAALRNNLLNQHIGDGRRSLAVCSAVAGTGASFLTANLAVALAQAGVRTLLIDGNLRDPSLSDYFKPSQAQPGLADYLADPNVVNDGLIQSEVLPNLSLIFAGEADGKAQELLASQNLKALVDNCVRNYDLVLVDTPPASTSSDARRLASVLRYALIVAMRDNSYVSDIRTLAGELQSDRVKVVGTFLNVA